MKESFYSPFLILNSSSNMIKTYTKSSLALEYFPEHTHRPRTAVQHLMRWINMNPELCTRLYALDPGFRCRRVLTFRQVLLIKEYLGEP
jgi:hypothetical protein